MSHQYARMYTPAFKFLVVFMPRTFTMSLVGSPESKHKRPAAGNADKRKWRTIPFCDVLFEGDNHQTRVDPIARQVAVQISQALAVLSNVPGRSVIDTADEANAA
jgi:hypothetical protein